MTESWTRDGTNFDSAITGYFTSDNATNPDQPTIPSRKVEITLPNQTKSIQYSYNYSSLPDTDPLKALDGLVYQDKTQDSAGTALQGSTSTWEKGAYESPRPLRVEKTNENQQMTAAEFSYGTVYNQVMEVRDFDYGGTTLLRSTRTTYQNSANYTNRHIFNLPLTVEIYAPDNVSRVSRTEYQYDGQTLTDTPNVVMHDNTFNPYAPPYEVCDCSQWDEWQINCLQWNCYWTSAYNSATDYRGNVTQVTSYSNAATDPATEPITETRRYDITGNLVTASTACCEQTSFEYTVDTQYAYPESKTQGSATDPYAQVKTSATYDFYTGLGRFAKDANGREASTDYDSNTLRPTTAILPTGAHTDYAYDDNLMTVTAITYAAPGVNSAIADQNVKYLNGRGQVRQEKARGPDNGQNQTWDAVDTVFNNLGQVFQQSSAYRVGSELPVLSTATYDALGRTTRVTAPDGSVTETYYNEKDFDTGDSYVPQRPDVASTSPGETTLVRDAWGRERWGRTDASGRLVEVVEPNPNGNGSVATGGLVTTYTYNTLGNLTETHQDAQTRSFKYDSLGRLTAQKLAEMNATLDDSGAYQTTGGTWSDVFTYDERSNLTSRTDARGVKTVYSYFIGGNPNTPDPLNRLQSVAWDTSGFGDTANPILSAAMVNYTYRTKANPSDPKDVTQLSSVSASGVSTEGYSFDSEGRVSAKTLTLTSRPAYPFVTDYTFDTLDRVTDVRYPAQYGNGSAPRKVVHHDYDNSSRLTSLTYDGQSFASNIVYNAASQTTSLKVGVTGTNQITENYSYDSQTGLLDNQTVARGATTLLDLSYDYAGANGKRTGQLTKILNNLNHNKDRGYSYDALGRLVQATGGPSTSVLWTQTYSYDRYGNRLTVTANGQSAKLYDKLKFVKPSDPKISLPTDLLAQNNSVELPNQRRTSPTVWESSESVSDTSTSLYNPSAAKASTKPALPPDGPPTFTNDPLEAGVTTIQALHITELRDAINALRVRAGLAMVGWAEGVSSGVTIKADHISEMRTRLDQALAALNLATGGYSAGLATGQPILAIHIQELRDRVVAAWTASSQIPRDGHASLSYDSASNRITTAGFAYDAAGNQTRALIPGGSGSQRFKYDAANRLVKVKADDNTTVLATYSYGDSNERLISEEGGLRTYYACGGSVEYIESGGSTTPSWSKSYVYFGGRLLSTVTPNGSGGEAVEYHHPDRLGTRLVTNPSTGSSFEQVTLPFGTALNTESTGATNRRFTSYDRNGATGLDYAINRHYDPQQGRFTQVDPIEMDSVDLEIPQTLNLYAYCENDPVNCIDPEGLGLISFFKRIFRAIGRFIAKVLTNKWVLLVAGIALGVLSGFGFYLAFTQNVVGTAVNTAFLAAAIGLAAMSAVLIVGAYHQGFLRVVRTISGIASSVQGIAGLIGGTINSGSVGTPPWNPNVNDFQRRGIRPPPRRRGQRGYRGPGSWHYGIGIPRRPVTITPLGYSSRYPRDYQTSNTQQYSAEFRSPAEAFSEAFRKMAGPTELIAPGKVRTLNGRWQLRAKPGDLTQHHLHLEYLNPATGEVLRNYHFTWPAPRK